VAARWLAVTRGLEFEVATRAAIAVAVPLLVLYLVGRVDLVAYASFGAMTALYGRSEPYRARLRTVTAAGVGLVLCIALGAAMAATSAPLLVVVIGLLVVITAGIVVAARVGMFPPTPIFFVFAFTVCALLPTPAAQLGWRILLALACATFAWLLVMSGWALRRMAGDRTSVLFKSLPHRPKRRHHPWRDPAVLTSIAQSLIGVLAAGAIAMALGIGHPYWAVVSVIAVLPPPGARNSISRSLHRIGGTAAGVVVTGFVLLPAPPQLVLIVVVVVAQFGAEVLVGRHYGAALLFITPLAITVSHLASPVPVGQLLTDRVIETALGATIGLVLVLLTRMVGRRLMRVS
jgi:Predicted membrane protein